MILFYYLCINVCINICIYSILVDCVWDAWVNGTCSTTCGAGQQTNSRVKLTEEVNGGTCTGESTEVIPCIDVECPGMHLSLEFDSKLPVSCVFIQYTCTYLNT